MSVTTATNTYDKTGSLLTKTDALGNTTSYAYDPRGNATQVTDAASKATSFAYDALGRLTSGVNARSVATTYVYDGAGNLTETYTAYVRQTQATYDLAGNRTSIKDANNNVTTFTDTLTGRLRESTLPGGYSTRVWYDASGRMVRATDSDGVVESTTYDAWGRTFSVTREGNAGALSVSISYAYDLLGRKVSETDPRGNTNTYTYDALGQALSAKNPLDQTTTYAYNKDGNVLSETNWLGNTVTYTYDALGRLLTTTDAEGHLIESIAYNDAGLKISSTDAPGNVTLYAYDACLRPISTTDAENYTVCQSYDNVGNIATRTDGRGKVTGYTYDSWNRLILVTNPDNSTVSYTYDAAGNMLTQIDGRGNTTTYAYNTQTLLIQTVDPDGFDQSNQVIPGYAETYTYSPARRLLTSTDKNGVTTTYTYDALGRLLSESTPGGTISYTYDASGNLLTESDGTRTTTRVYDALNRVTSKTVTGFAATIFTYDITASLSAGYVAESSAYGSVTVTKTYDRAGRLVSVKEGADTTSYTYLDNGRLESETLPNGYTSAYTYFDNGKLKTLTQRAPGGALFDTYQYAYDAAGNMTAKQDVKGTTTYTYTDLSQPLTVTEPSGKVTTYAYDASGNRTSETIVEGNMTAVSTYTVDARNRLTEVVEVKDGEETIHTYAYDNARNLISDMPEILQSLGQSPPSPTLSLDDDLSAAIYEYNDRNQLICADTDGVTVENTFGPEGYRATKTEDGVTTTFLYEYDKIVLEQTGNDTTVNVWGLRLISRTESGTKAYYLYNGHGDVTALLASNGSVLASYYYDAFGVILEETGGSLNPFRYCGYYYDEALGIYDLKARFYKAEIARFLHEDLFTGFQDMTLTLNRYVYYLTKVDSEVQKAANLIKQDFTASRPNEKWLTDITEIPCADGKLYLAPVFDCFDGSIRAYST